MSAAASSVAGSVASAAASAASAPASSAGAGAGAAMAAGTAVSAASSAPAASAPGSLDMLQYGASFALVIALLVGLLWALKRLQRGRVFARREQRLQVVESMALGARHKVALIRVDHREVLVGITATQINTLASWSQPAGSAPSAQSRADAGGDFQADLARARSAFERNRE